MDRRGDQPAMVWRGAEYSYRSLIRDMEFWGQRLNELGIVRGTVCGVVGEYSPGICGLMFSLMKVGAVIVPFTHASAVQVQDVVQMANIERLFRFDDDDGWSVEPVQTSQQNELLASFRERDHPGLILFTSGSTGKPKGILHDCELLLQKFSTERRGYRTLLFLLMDHIGGFNTLMSVFAYGGTGVVAANRMADEICRTVEESQVELLPVTPTFLNLLLASNSYKDFDLSSVLLITYGTEVMPETTLERVSAIFPSARFQQTYGLSELGILRSKSKESASVWVQVGGQGFETKVVDGMLHVRAQSAMVGYLNEPSPFDDEGWMNTGDMVEVDGEYIRILGRESEVINVGGQKVLPIEVETVLMAADNVVEATVYGVSNPLMGSTVAARVSLENDEDPIRLKVRLRKFCLARLAAYKVPIRFSVVSHAQQHNQRVKKIRQNLM